MIKQFLLVGIGGMAGSMLRYASGLLFNSTTFPWATFTVNIIGSFLIGIILGTVLKTEQDSTNFRLLLATGFCGGFTTFSALSAEGIQMLQEQRYTIFLLYFALSITIGLLASWLGLVIAR